MKILLLTLILSSTTAMATDLVSKLDTIVPMNELTSIEVSSTEECSTEALIASDLSGIYKRKEKRINAIHSVVLNISKELKINPCIVMSMIAQESSFNKSAKSGIGAKGLKQVMPSTKKYVVKTLGYNLNKLVSRNLNSGISVQEITSIIVGSTYFKSLVVKLKNNQANFYSF